MEPATSSKNDDSLKALIGFARNVHSESISTKYLETLDLSKCLPALKLARRYRKTTLKTVPEKIPQTSAESTPSQVDQQRQKQNKESIQSPFSDISKNGDSNIVKKKKKKHEKQHNSSKHALASVSKSSEKGSPFRSPPALVKVQRVFDTPLFKDQEIVKKPSTDVKNLQRSSTDMLKKRKVTKDCACQKDFDGIVPQATATSSASTFKIPKLNQSNGSDESQVKISALTAEMTKMKTENDTLVEKNERFKLEMKEMREEIAQQKREIDRLLNEGIKLEQEHIKSKRMVKSVSNEMTIVRQKMKQLENENTRLKTEKQQEEKRPKSTDNSGENIALRNLKRDCAFRGEKMAELADIVDKLEKQIESFSEINDELADALRLKEEFRCENEFLKRRVDKESARADTLVMKLENLEGEFIRLIINKNLNNQLDSQRFYHRIKEQNVIPEQNKPVQEVEEEVEETPAKEVNELPSAS